MYEGNRKSITDNERGVIAVDKFEDTVTPMQITKEYREAIDIFPALHKYKTDHNIENLQKLCVEISDFSRAVYASTRNNEERQVFRKMLDKLNEM